MCKAHTVKCFEKAQNDEGRGRRRSESGGPVTEGRAAETGWTMMILLSARCA